MRIWRTTIQKKPIRTDQANDWEVNEKQRGDRRVCDETDREGCLSTFCVPTRDFSNKPTRPVIVKASGMFSSGGHKEYPGGEGCRYIHTRATIKFISFHVPERLSHCSCFMRCTYLRYSNTLYIITGMQSSCIPISSRSLGLTLPLSLSDSIAAPSLLEFWLSVTPEFAP